MRRIQGLSIIAISAIAIVFSMTQVKSWDNFKLQNFSLTQMFHDQTHALDDTRQIATGLETPPRIDLEELLNGGPPKDGIPSIDLPQFDRAESTPFQHDDWVIGIVVNGEAKAYPLNILNWHEIVNDTVGGVGMTITYCPLCDTVVAFERGKATFGVSGKLYQSCLVMYDRQDDTLYAQPWGMGIVGPRVNQSLDRVPAVKVSLSNWLKQYPHSQILSTNTGYQRNYQAYPYGTYNHDRKIIFPVRNQTQRTLHPKAEISYVWQADSKTPNNQFSGASHQFVHADIKKMGSQEVEFAGRTLRADWDNQLSTVIIKDSDETVVPSSNAFSFVYPAFFTE